MSTVTLTISASMFSQYWGAGFSIQAATFILLATIFFMNACGVRLYGNMESVFKWLKILLILLVCIVMIAIKAGAGPKDVHGYFHIAEGYSPTGYFRIGTNISTLPTVQLDVPLPGTGGTILTVWTCLTLAMFQFMGGEMVLVTAAEAESPRRDLPTAARYMYTLPVSLYLIGILLVGLNIDYMDPELYHPHVDYYLSSDRLDGISTAFRSPFVIVVLKAGIRFLPGFLNAAFLFSAITAA